MSSRPWMPFYINDFISDTLDLRADEIGCYMLMLMLAWRRDDAALPNDMPWLKRSLKACCADLHGHTFNRIVPKLLQRYFVLFEDGKWRNKRLSAERFATSFRASKQRQRANKRWADYKHFKDLGDAAAMPITITKKERKKEGLSEPEKVASPWLIAALRKQGWEPE